MSDPNTPQPEDHVRTSSRPSELRITDLRTATVGWDTWFFTIIRIDTNQGLSGYGEVRDLASKNYALALKPRLRHDLQRMPPSIRPGRPGDF